MSVIETKLGGGVLTVTLNRPDVENAVNSEMLDALLALLDHIERDGEIHGVLVRGAGRSFCTGLDPREAGKRSFYPSPKDRPYVSDVLKDQWSRWRVWRRFAELSKPVVASVQGRALGEGAALIMLADMSVAAETAEFGDPSIRMGMASANPLWLWSVGPRRAREIYFGRFIDAHTALRWGLVSRVVPEADLHEAAMTALTALISHTAGMTGSDGHAAHQYLDRAATAAAGLWTAFDFAEGIAAMSAIQRAGVRVGEYDFWTQVEERGVDAALEERDRRYAATSAANSVG